MTDNYKTLLDEISKSKEEISKLQKDLNKKLKLNFNKLTKELFITYPELKSFGWRQYTPYFNDGEACVFSSEHIDYPIINGHDENYGDNDQEDGEIDIVSGSKKTIKNKDWQDISNPNYNKYYNEIVTNVKKFLSKFDEDDMHTLFGDHVSVNITIDGCKTEEYEHD